MERSKVLVTTSLLSDFDLRPLKTIAEVYPAKDLSESQLNELLPTIRAMIVSSWPKALNDQRTVAMRGLRFVQSILAGVDSIPFGLLSTRVIVCSNVGAYSAEVAEFGWALILSSAKRIPQLNDWLRRGLWKSAKAVDVAEEIKVLHGKRLGVVGYGGIGKEVARKAASFGMSVSAFSREKQTGKGIRFFWGKEGLEELLAGCDVVILSLPLTKLTTGIIGKDELRRMKRDGILVNVGRAELLDQQSLFEHLRRNQSFRYATDVWWSVSGVESFKPRFPFFTLSNFIGTPHTSGPSALPTGRPMQMAVRNTLRFLKGERPQNVVLKTDYL